MFYYLFTNAYMFQVKSGMETLQCTARKKMANSLAIWKLGSENKDKVLK